MASQEIVDYVREQLSAGYSIQEITNELKQQGWAAQEIAEAFEIAGPSHVPPVTPPVKLPSGSSKLFLLPFIGGILVFITGLESLLELPLISALAPGIQLTGFFVGMLVTSVNIGSVTLVFAVIMITGSLLMNRRVKKIGGILTLIFSILALAGLPGFLPVIGGILGIVGSLLILKSGFEKYPSPLSPASSYPEPPRDRAGAPGS